MTYQDVSPTVIPQTTLTSAIRRLRGAHLNASVLQPDEGPSEIAVSYLPRRREGFMQAFMRAQYDTTYWRVWSASDGTARISSDQFAKEWTYTDIDAAVSALAGITAKTARA